MWKKGGNPLGSTDMTKFCDGCKAWLKPDAEYRHLSAVLCEECYLERRIERKRKSHWQYIKSVKIEYLRPGKNEG